MAIYWRLGGFSVRPIGDARLLRWAARDARTGADRRKRGDLA
jgi:hypothetical protein